MQAHCAKYYGQNFNAKDDRRECCELDARALAARRTPAEADRTLAACREQHGNVGGGISTKNMQAKINNCSIRTRR